MTNLAYPKSEIFSVTMKTIITNFLFDSWMWFSMYFDLHILMLLNMQSKLSKKLYLNHIIYFFSGLPLLPH